MFLKRSVGWVDGRFVGWVDGRFVGWSVGISVSHKVQKGREVPLPYALIAAFVLF